MVRYEDVLNSYYHHCKMSSITNRFDLIRLCTPISVFMGHLCIGDTWNTINNVEKEQCDVMCCTVMYYYILLL